MMINNLKNENSQMRSRIGNFQVQKNQKKLIFFINNREKISFYKDNGNHGNYIRIYTMMLKINLI